MFFPADRTSPFGWQDPAQWDAYGDWMHAQRAAQAAAGRGAALTNEFLPGEGLEPPDARRAA